MSEPRRRLAARSLVALRGSRARLPPAMASGELAVRTNDIELGNVGPGDENGGGGGATGSQMAPIMAEFFTAVEGVKKEVSTIKRNAKEIGEWPAGGRAGV